MEKRIKKGITLLLSLLGFSYSFWITLNQLTRKFSRTSAQDFTFQVVYLIEDFAALILMALVIAGVVFSLWKKEKPERRFPKGFWIGGLVVFVVVFGTSIIVNPRGFYGTSLFPQLSDSTRAEKLGLFNELEEYPELVIIGSSRALTLSPTYIQDTLGYTTFNFAVGGPRLDDLMLISQFLLDDARGEYPEVILFEIARVPNIYPEFTASRAPLQFLPYMEPKMVWYSIWSRSQELFSAHQFGEALYVIRNSGRIEPATYWTVLPDSGSAFNPPYTLAEALEEHLSGTVSGDCQLNVTTALTYVEKIISLAGDKNIPIVFYISPVPPESYEHMDKTPGIKACYEEFRDHLAGYEEQYPLVFFEDFSNIYDINGYPDERGFYDEDHMTPINSNLLADALAETIKAAFEATP